MKYRIILSLIIIVFCFGSGNLITNAQTASPSIVSITSVVGSGTFDVGAVIPISIKFSSQVYKLGSFSLNLNTTPVSQCIISGSDPSTTLSCVYTVKAGDTTNGAPLNVTGLTLNSPIYDLVGNTVSTNLPAVNLASTSAIIIDATHTTVANPSFCSIMANTFEPANLSTTDMAGIQRFFVSRGYNGLLVASQSPGTASGTASYDVSGVYDTATRQALGGFQLLNGLTLSGSFDQYTRALMAKLSGCANNTVVDIRNGSDFAEILKPNTQEVWKAGKTYAVKYKIQKQINPTVTISLSQILEATSATGTVATSTRPITANLKIFTGKNGTYTTYVTVPSYLPKGMYQLSMTVARTRSDRFTVLSKAPIDVRSKAIGDLPTIDITNPILNAVWNKQSNQFITWEYEKRANVKVWVSIRNTATNVSYLLSSSKGFPNSAKKFPVKKQMLKNIPSGIYYAVVQQVVTSGNIPYLAKGVSDTFVLVDGALQPIVRSIDGENGAPIAVNKMVTLTGNNFSDVSNDINFTAASSTNASSTIRVTRALTGIAGTSTSITFPLPSRVCSFGNANQCIDLGNGTYQVSVTTRNGTSNPISFSLQNGIGTSTPPVQSTSTPPVATTTPVLINQILPSSGPTGTNVQIIGTGFHLSENTVNFGAGSILNLPSVTEAGATTSTIWFNVPSALVPECLTRGTCSQNAQVTGVGTYAITVKNINGISATSTFTVLPSQY